MRVAARLAQRLGKLLGDLVGVFKPLGLGMNMGPLDLQPGQVGLPEPMRAQHLQRPLAASLGEHRLWTAFDSQARTNQAFDRSPHLFGRYG